MNSDKKTCVVCHSYLFDDDDVVYCPVCGAPHHRDCYNSIGECGLAKYHGTQNQYDKLKEEYEAHAKKESAENTENEEKEDLIKCNICGNSYNASEPVCPNCKSPNYRIISGYYPIDPLGGVPHELDLGEGVTAKEAGRFVLANSQRYIPKFANFKAGKKLSWNWFAFLFPSGFLFSRKMYIKGSLAGIALIIFNLFENLFSIALYNDGGLANLTYAEILSTVSAINKKILIISFIAATLDLILRILLGIFGDLIYRNYAVSSIAKIKKNSDDIEADMNKKGGINIGMMIVGIFGVSLLSNILATLF